MRAARCIAGALSLCAPALAQQYPAKPILIIVPLAAASGSDVAVRTVTERLSPVLKQPILVENQPGAAGLIGTERAAKAAPDGYTLTALNNSIMTMIPAIHGKVGYDPEKSFAPITMLVLLPTSIFVHPSLPVKSVKELVALAKSKPGQLLYSSGGVGSPQHLATEMFRSATGINMVHVPYKGAVAAATDLIGGHVQVLITGLAFALPYVKSGKLRALAMTESKRSSIVPEIPTVQEAGIPGFVFEQWLGLFAPARTPPEILARLNADTAKLLATPELRNALLKQGLEPQGGPAENVTRVLRDDLPKMAKIIKDLGIKPDS